ncbi:MAG TPA: DUF6240 domain-containing protein [Mobilitalea sp.]|nr:DUF6240 domain-containing protein [Mobilitalea sp.]
MDYSFVIESGTGSKTNKLSANPAAVKNEKGLTSLIKGQQIKGTVVSVGDEVTLDFNGIRVAASNSVIGNAALGDVKTFEVVKSTKSEIELKLLDENFGSDRSTFRAAMDKDTDWESILSQKEKAAKKAEKESEVKETKAKLDEIGAKLTEADCRRLEEEGFPVENLSVTGLYEAIDRVKKSASKENQKATDDVTSTNNIINDKAIEDKLKQANLPVTPVNIAKVNKALDLSDAVTRMDDKAMQYLISQGAEPTAENIYKACYSSPTQNTEKLQEKDWKDLEGQVKEVIKSTGYEVNQDNLDTAKWIIESKLPLTEETFTYKKELDQIKSSSDKESMLNKMVEGMKQGINPKDAALTESKDISYEKVLTDINFIQPETVSEAVNTGMDLTISKLVTLQDTLKSQDSTSQTSVSQSAAEQEADKSVSVNSDTVTSGASPADDTGLNMNQGTDQNTDEGGSNSQTGSSAYEEIKAKRQLEEIRLKMTLEAAAQLEKKGFQIETQQLGKVVEALRDLENNYYKEYLKEADAEVTDASLQIVKDTTTSLEQLQSIPCYVLGTTLADRNTITIPNLLSEGNKLQADLNKAGSAYEALMTVPNREYGDSIKKAFANADSLLSEMNIENTEMNQRAVRILGYNQMEINQDTINQVKAYDLQVTTMMKNLQPAVTVRMIKEGLNPLDMPINELNQTIDRMKEEQGITSEDKYSTYLRQLEKSGQITGEERKAYIGIYRLLYNVDKSDGSALGAVIKADRPVTLENLLTAVQTSKKGRIDAVINDEFGTVQSVTRSKESIAEQLSGFRNNENQQNSGQSASEDTVSEQIEYLSRLLKEMKDELTPEKLKEAAGNEAQSQTIQSQTTQAAVSAAEQLRLSQKGIWETMKNISVEKLYEQLQNADGTNTAEDGAYTGKVQELQELCKNSEQSIRFLNNYHVSSTPLNLMMAKNLLSNAESPIKKLMKLQKENKVENSENSLKEINDLSDTLIDKHSMEEAYSQLETDAKAALNQSYSEEKIDSRKLAELKSIGQQISFIRTLAEKEYYQIPIETEKGITNMNLTIQRGTQTSGKVSVTIHSEQLGNVKAEFTLKDKALQGYISSDDRSGLEQLQRSSGEIQTAAEESAVSLKQMDFVMQSKDNEAYSYPSPSLAENESSTNADTERTLYRIAKAVVYTVRSAEASSDKEQAAS